MSNRVPETAVRWSSTRAAGAWCGHHLGDVRAIGDLVDAVELVDGATQEFPEPLGVGRHKSGEDPLLDVVETTVELWEQTAAAGGGDDLVRPSVGDVDTALDELGVDELVDEVGHDGAIDAESPGERTLAGGRSALDADQ